MTDLIEAQGIQTQKEVCILSGARFREVAISATLGCRSIFTAYTVAGFQSSVRLTEEPEIKM